MKNIVCNLFIMLSSLFYARISQAQAVIAQDSLALVDLYNSTNGPNWGGHEHWLQGPVNTWAYITLTENKTRVKAVYLPGNNLTGIIPTSIGNLTACESLNLSFNNLKDTIPSSIGRLDQVKFLNLHVNYLSGKIPYSIGLLPNLEVLSLDVNHLSGKIPASLVTTPHLNTLTIQYNKFTFEGLEELVTRGLPAFSYYSQDTVLPLNRRNNTFSVSAGGTLSNNTYEWYVGGGIPFDINIGDSTLTSNATGGHVVYVRNSIATNLTLYSETKYETAVEFYDPNTNLPSQINADGSLNPSIWNIGYYQPISKAATDGVTKILVVSYSTAPVTYSIAPGHGGMLSSLTNQNTYGRQVVITPDNIGRTIAIYTVPDGYGYDNQSEKFADITVVRDGDTIGHNKLYLVKPPVVLVHGMWSGPEVWETGGFDKALSVAGFKNVFHADYSYANASTFDPASAASLPGRNAVADATNRALTYYRSNGVAATQVDIIGHSLGGLMSRSWSQQPNFKILGNFQQGFIHKLITLGTPHRGSPLGPELVASQYNLIKLPFTDYVSPLPVWLVLSLVNMPVGKCHADFAINSPGINALTATLPFKSYSIVGDQAGQILGYLAFYAMSLAALNHSYPEIFRASFPCTNVLENDLVVPLSSQKGYITASQRFFSTGHSIPAFTTETNNPLIHAKVIRLLLSDSTSEFSNGFPAPSQFPLDCTTANQRMSSSLARPAHINDTTTDNIFIKITSPSSTYSVQQHSGDSIILKYEKSTGARPANCVFMVEGIGWFTITDSTNKSATFKLPANSPVGKLHIVLLAKDSSGIILGDTTHLEIQPDGLLDSMAISPATILLDSTLRQSTANINGYYVSTDGDTTINNITSSITGTNYQAKVGGVFSVSKEGLITAIQVGSDTLIVTNGVKSARTKVTVNNSFAFATKYPNAITFDSIPDVYVGDEPVALKGSSLSGAAINYSLTAGQTTLVNGVVGNFLIPGIVSISASVESSPYFLNASPVTRTFRILSHTLYTFTGNGNWSNAANWSNGLIPPENLPRGSEIIIDPIINGECILNVSQRIENESSIKVQAGKKLRILGNLILNN